MKKLIWILPVLLLIPRVLRILAPDVQVEDPNYIYGAFLILKGMIPFHDFAQPNPPLLEAVVAGLYALFGVTHRVPEILSAIAFFLTSLGLFFLGSRWFSRTAGTVAALCYSVHPLVFRYHVFERETYATLAVLGGLLLVSEREPGWKNSILAGAVMGLGFVCKQTALVPMAAVVIIYLLLHRKWKPAFGLMAGFALFVGMITSVYVLQFGKAYLRQTFWFHFIKGQVAPWPVKAEWTLAGFGYLAPLAAGAIALLRFDRKHPAWIPIAMVIADLAFFWFASGAFWPHYLLSTLMPLSLLAGYAVSEWFLPVHAGTRGSRIRVLTSLAIGVLALAGMLTKNPKLLVGEGAAERFGFAGTPRSEIREYSQFIESHTKPDDLIIAEPFIALEAHRIIVVRFMDNWGLVLWLNSMMEQGTYLEIAKKLNREPFGNVRKFSHRFWMPLVETAFFERRIGAVIPNYELPLSDEILTKYGFSKGMSSDNSAIWIRDPSYGLP